MSSAGNDRMTELEMQLAHLQRLYEQLNQVVTAQSLESSRMERRIVQLQNQLKELKAKPLPESNPLDDKPPHY